MRASFRSELKKINDSQRSGAGEDEIYSPHLWYFEHLKFLTDQETPRESTSNVEHEPVESQVQTDEWELMSSPPSVLTSGHGADLEEHLSSSTSYSARTSTPTSNESTSKAVTVRQKRRQTNKAEDVLEKVSKQLDEIPDKFSTVGINIANKLRELPTEASTVAEKMINDILFEVQMGNISRHTKVVLQDTRRVEPQLPIQTTQTSQNPTADYYSAFCSNVPDMYNL